MKLKITTRKVRNYYDNFIGHLKYDHIRGNQRHIRIKNDLKNIIKEGMKVLDLGCGTGITTKYIAELGAKVTGIDLSPKLIEFAKENSAHENAEYFIGDITKVDLYKNLFDVICLCDIMEHIPREKIPDLIKNIRRYAHKNTVIYLNIPDARLQSWMKKNKPGKLQIIDEEYSITNILDWFRSIDFEVINIKVYGIDFPLQYNSYIFVKKDIFYHNYKKYQGGESDG